jgi:hypothetical protein
MFVFAICYSGYMPGVTEWGGVYVNVVWAVSHCSEESTN